MKDVDISSWNVSKGINFCNMFAFCFNLTSDFSNWSLDSVKDAKCMF